MTINEYLQNPYGKGSAFAGASQQIEKISKEFEGLKDKITHKSYQYQKTIIYHVVVPSTKRETSYDVIIEVDIGRIPDKEANLEAAPLKVFSNCPSFIFTYANVFYKNKMLCPWLINKYSDQVRLTQPSQTNRYGIIGLERSLYLAMKYLHAEGYTRKGSYLATSKKVSSKSEIARSVRTQDQVMNSVRTKLKPDESNTTESGGEDGDFVRKSISERSSRYRETTEIKTKTTPKTKVTKTAKSSDTSMKSTKKTKTTKKV